MNPVVRNIPNALTIVRALLIPAIVYAYAQDAPGPSVSAAALFVAAALTDFFDGIIARRLNAQTEFGRWVDPVVDRAFYFTTFSMLWYLGTLPLWAVLPLLLRDGIMLVMALPVRMFTRFGPNVSRWGRAATTTLICSIFCFLIDLRTIGWVLLAVGGTLYVGSALLYLVRGVRMLREGRAAWRRA